MRHSDLFGWLGIFSGGVVSDPASYVSPGTAHEWQTWRRSLYQFLPLIFR